MSAVTVASFDQSAIEAAIVSAGNGGVVVFPRGDYLVTDLVASTSQTWRFEPGAKLIRTGGTSPILSLDCDALKVEGGIFDVNGGSFTATKPFAIHGIGSSLQWSDGELMNSPAWGIQMDDGDLVLDRINFHHLAYAAVHWRAMTQKSATVGDYRDGPKIRNCRIARRDGYLSSGGILVNSGGGTSSAFRALVQDCDFIMPISTVDHNVACEFNYVQLGGMIGNTLDGSRIGFSTGNCSGVVMTGNRSKNVSNYAHELVHSEWGVVNGNTATGLYPPSLSGCELSGTSRSNVVTNNTFRQGFPVPVRNQSTAFSGYPNYFSGNL